jgi:hypothetical protein
MKRSASAGRLRTIHIRHSIGFFAVARWSNQADES